MILVSCRAQSHAATTSLLYIQDGTSVSILGLVTLVLCIRKKIYFLAAFPASISLKEKKEAAVVAKLGLTHFYCPISRVYLKLIFMCNFKKVITSWTFRERHSS